MSELSDETPIRVAVAVVEHNGEFLVGVRPGGVPLAGLAEFPGGKVLAGELPEEAAIRECGEESGLDVEVVEQYFSTVHRYEHGLLQIHFFRCRPINHPAVKSPRSPFRWVKAAELATLEFPAANARLMEMLLRQAAVKSG